MRNPVANGYRKWFVLIGVENGDADFATVPGVDRAWAVHNRDAMFRSEPAARNHKREVAVWKGNRHPSSDRRALTRGQDKLFGRTQVGTSIAWMRILWHPVATEENFNTVIHTTRLVQTNTKKSDRIEP